MATASGRPRSSLRRRLIVGITLVASVAAFAVALLLHVVWYGYEQRLIDRVVSDELRRSVEIHAREPALAYPNTGDLTLYVVPRHGGPGGDALPEYLRPLLDASVVTSDPSDPGRGPDAARASGPAGTKPPIVVREVRGPGGVDVHVGVAHRGELAFVLAYDAREHDERRSDLLLAVLAIAVVVSFAASRAALLLVDRLLAGLSRLQHRVADAGGRGFADDDMDVEVAALADALDTQRLLVAAALRKERAFAAAASHELRTPLTRIATGADVMLAQPDLAPALQARLRSVRGSVDELQRLLDVLLQVARWQPGPTGEATVPANSQPRSLGAVVDECVARLAGEARLLGVAVELDVAAPDRSVTQPAMLDVVVSNLLRNAIRHGRGAPVTVRERDGVLEVLDGGPGIAPEAVERVFDPFWRGDAEDTGPAGLGLGLTIAERICAAAGWRLSIGNRELRGMRAAIRLVPEAAA